MTDFLPSWSPISTALATTATVILVSIPTVKLLRLHARLSTLVAHILQSGERAQHHIRNLSSTSSSKTQEPSAFPEALIADPGSFRILHDNASLSVPTSQLPFHPSVKKMLVTYLRHNMTLFSRLPQAYAIYLMTPQADRGTFDRSYIAGLGFDEGDIVNGLYRVVSNKAIVGDNDDYRASDARASSGKPEPGWRIVMSMKQGEVEGRMIFSVLTKENARSEEQQTTSFLTDTYMWVPHNSTAVMPLERVLPKWGHELTSWWLLEKGTAHLRELRRQEVAEGHEKQMR